LAQRKGSAKVLSQKVKSPSVFTDIRLCLIQVTLRQSFANSWSKCTYKICLYCWFFAMFRWLVHRCWEIVAFQDQLRWINCGKILQVKKENVFC